MFLTSASRLWFAAGACVLLVGALAGVTTLWRRERTDLMARADLAEAASQNLARIANRLGQERVAAEARYAALKPRWRTIVETVTDSVPVPVEVIVRVADSTIAACDTALNACAAEVAVLRPALDSALSAAKLRKEALTPRRLFGFLPLPEVKPCANASAFYALDDQRFHAGVGGGLCLTF